MNQEKSKTGYCELKDDILAKLKLIKQCEQFKDNPDDFAFFIGSIIRYIEPSTNKELADIVYRQQYNMLSNFEKKLMALLSSASEDNLSKLVVVYPKYVTAWKKYGRTSVWELEQILKDN